MAANRNSSSASSRQRTQTEGSSHNALSFLERSHRSRSSTLPPAVTSPWPVGFVPPSETKVERAFTWTTHVSSTSLPRTSALAFMERPSVGSSNGSSLGAGADAEAGLGWLSGGVVAASYGRGGFLPRSNSSAGGSGSWDSDEEMDSNVCPSMLFTCFPCLSCFRYGIVSSHIIFYVQVSIFSYKYCTSKYVSNPAMYHPSLLQVLQTAVRGIVVRKCADSSAK